MLKINKLHVKYQRVIEGVSDISLKVRDGEIVALLGANGAGKSTTLRAISGLLNYYGGTVVDGDITLDDRDITHVGALRAVQYGIAQVVEGRPVLPHLTVEQNLVVGGARLKSRSAREERLKVVFDIFPALKELRRRPSGYLSGGEQQMMLFGRALMMKPRFVLLDEPSLGLAPVIVGRLFDAVNKLRAREKMGFLIVEQNIRMALRIADRAYIARNGAIRYEGTGTELQNDNILLSHYFG